MTSVELLSFLRARPFVPFSFRTVDGREISVPHPECIAYTGGRIAIVLNPGGDFEVIDVFLVPSSRAQTVPSRSGPESGQSQPA